MVILIWYPVLISICQKNTAYNTLADDVFILVKSL